MGETNLEKADDAEARAHAVLEADSRYQEACSAYQAGHGSWDDVISAWNDTAIAKGGWSGAPYPNRNHPLAMAPQYPLQVSLKRDRQLDEEESQRVRELAYFLWEEAGRPEGRSDVMWRTAARWSQRPHMIPYFRHHRRVRYAAYYLWVEAGRPWGREEEFWRLASEMHKHLDPGNPYENEPIYEGLWTKTVNSWTMRSGATVYVKRDLLTGKSFAEVDEITVRDRMAMFASLLDVSGAWSLRAEEKAQEKLKSLINEESYRRYVLTGMFSIESPRSRLTYVFRKGRPTIVVRTGTLETLCCLCLHPQGYYKGTWAGAMTPTDDVIAHLLLMRHDEKNFWKKATHHRADTYLAGIA